MSSPVYAGGEEVPESGVSFQVDIIPSVEGCVGTSAEDTVALADEALRQETQEYTPELWKRMMQKRSYPENKLNIRLSPDVLPTYSTAAYLRPLLFNKAWAISAK